jgi:nitrite reductase/ring-hydroxylating ferredoxin subunit
MADSAVSVPEGELPLDGQIVGIAIEGSVSVALANVNGEYFAFQEICTHEECSLSEGYLEDHRVVCSCHGGTFDVRDGEAVDGPVYVPLTVYPVTRSGSDVTIHTDQGRRPD